MFKRWQRNWINMLNLLYNNNATTTIKDVELLGVGKWFASSGIVDVTAQDLEVVRHNIASGELAPVGLSFGHNTDPQFVKDMANAFGLQSTLPLTGDNTGQGATTLGQVANPRIIQNGLKLVGDIINVPSKLAQFMGKGFGYNTVSPTLVPAWPGLNGKIIKGPVMIALGLLGAQYPAFGVQKGLEAAQKMANQLKSQFSNLEGMPEEVFVLTGFQFQGDEQMTTPNGGYFPGYPGMNPGQPGGYPYPIIMHGISDYNPGGMGQLKSGQDGQKYPLMLEFEKMAESIKEMNGNIEKFLTAQQEQMTLMAGEQFRASVSAAAQGWTHLPEEARDSAVNVIVELNGKSPEAAKMMIEQHNMMAGLVSGTQQQQQGQQQQGQQPDPNEFVRQSLGGAGAQPGTQHAGNQDPGELLNQTINGLVQSTGLRYSEAYNMLAGTPSGEKLIAAAQRMNALANSGMMYAVDSGQQQGQQQQQQQQVDSTPVITPESVMGNREGAMMFSGSGEALKSFVMGDPRRRPMPVARDMEE